MHTYGNTALALRSRDSDDSYDGLTMVVSPAEALRRIQELQAFVHKVMQRGVDYDVIPGAGNKPTLLQPGAQKLCEIYGFAFSFEDIQRTEDWDRPLFVYVKRCVLTSRKDGRFICDGVGSCNSREDRYAWRWVSEKQLPPGADKKTLRTRITKFGPQFRLPNEDVFSLVNTMEKMACKRALIMAVSGATRSSGIFTQDVEDLPLAVFGEVEDVRSWEQEKPTLDALLAIAEKLETQLVEAQSLADLEAVGVEIKKTKSLPNEMLDSLRQLYGERKILLKRFEAQAPATEGA